MTINDAEETLDRLMLEPRVGRGTPWEEALTFVTYLRRLTRSVTTLAVVVKGDRSAIGRMEAVAERLDGVSASLLEGDMVRAAERDGVTGSVELTPEGVAEQQMRRMERQAGVLERTAAELMQSAGM